MKVALLTSKAYPETLGGIELYVHRLALALSSHGHEPVVFTQDCIEKNSLPYEVCEIGPTSNLVHEFLSRKIGIAHFHSLDNQGFSLDDVFHLKAAGIRIVITFHLANNTCVTGDLMAFSQEKCKGKMSPSICSACYLHRRLGNKSLAEALVNLQNLLLESKSFPAEHMPKLTLRSIRDHFNKVEMVLEQADAMIAISNWYLDVLRENGVPNDRLWHIPHLYPDVAINRTPRTSSKKIIYVGRITADKGIITLLNAWQLANPKSLSLTIIGPCSENKLQQRLSHITQQSKTIAYLGKKGHDLTMKIMSQHDVLVLPSNYEMAPLVLGEAILSGLSIIGSDNQGIIETGRKGSHAFFKNGDAEDLSEILNALDSGVPVFSSPKDKMNFMSPEQLAKAHSIVYSSER